MASINLVTKYANKLEQPFTAESVIRGALSGEYDFTGAKTVRILTATTVAPGDYNRAATSNRFGTPTEMGDVMQELTLTQDKGYSLTIDKGNLMDQNSLKQAGAMQKRQDAEQVVPMMDRYIVTKIALNAGQAVGSATALSKSNVAERIAAGVTALDDAEAPTDNRWLYVPANVYAMIRLSPEFLAADNLVNKAIVKGQVGEYQGMNVVKVPAGRWLSGMNFLIVHKDSAIAPHKIKTRRILSDVQGIDGNVLEGRDYYDAFVIGARANGVYVDFNTATLTRCATPTQSSGTFASTTAGVSFKYTNDGSDPRYSATAIVAASESEATGTPIKVCAFKAGAIISDVLSYTA